MNSRTKLLLGLLGFVALFALWTLYGPGGGEEAPTPRGGGPVIGGTRSGRGERRGRFGAAGKDEEDQEVHGE